MNEKQQELKQIEEKLYTLAEKDKQNWSSFYLLIKKVEVERLWEESHKSFTAWVKHFANVSKLQESVLWNRKKAGEIYQNYRNRKLEQNEEVEDVQSVNIAQDTLILIEKIARNDVALQDELTDKAINRELKKKDLQQAYKIVKAQKERERELKAELDLMKAKKSEKVDVNLDDENRIRHEIDNIKESTLTAMDIVNALSSPDWLNVYKMKSDNEKKTLERFKQFYNKTKYATFEEFPVYTGVTRKSRRIDVLVCENLTTERYNINLHAVEIKVSKGDLLNDHKYTEYAEFVDYLWLAIPESLLEFAIESKLNECGILIMNDEKEIKIVEQAERLNPSLREKCLETLALKLL